MTHNGWENAEITVPTAAMAGLHKNLRDWINTHHDAVRAMTVTLHKEIGQGTRSVKLYEERLQAAQRKHWNRIEENERRGWGYRTPSASAVAKTLATAVALEILEDMVHRAGRDASKTIHQPTVAEIAHLAPKVNNRTATFKVTDTEGHEAATIDFRSNVVTWDVPEGNHAVERAHAAPLALAFFAALDKINWTRNSGGFGTGNDEYNEDDRSAGGGANYVTFAYGPKGEAEKLETDARNMGMTVAAYKKMRASAPVRKATHNTFTGGRW